MITGPSYEASSISKGAFEPRFALDGLDLGLRSFFPRAVDDDDDDDDDNEEESSIGATTDGLAISSDNMFENGGPVVSRPDLFSSPPPSTRFVSLAFSISVFGSVSVSVSVSVSGWARCADSISLAGGGTEKSGTAGRRFRYDMLPRALDGPQVSESIVSD